MPTPKKTVPAKKATPAAKSAPAKAPAAKASTSRALTDWDEKLASKVKAAQKVASSIGGGSRNVLSFKGGRMSYQGGFVPDNNLNVIILKAINENNFFEGQYDPNSPASPLCYAFGSPDGEDEGMGPDKTHFKGHEGDIQSETGRCVDCAHNEWGSAEKGRGKACKNQVSLAFVTADALDSIEAMEKAEVIYAKLPVTSGKSWKGYINELGDRHFLEFVTNIQVTPSGETYVVEFSAQDQVERNEVFGALVDKSDKEDAKKPEAYPVFEEAPKPQRGGRRVIPVKAAGKAAAAKPRKF